jgi:hypothetical protein
LAAKAYEHLGVSPPDEAANPYARDPNGDSLPLFD